MKNFVIALIAFMTLTAQSFAEEHFRKESSRSWGLGLATIQWNDALKLQQGVSSAKDFANYNGLLFSLQKEVTYVNWGWSAAGFLGSGQANGGGNNTIITYAKDKVGFTVYGVSPRIFYRISERVNTGFSVMAFMRTIEWPTDNTNQTVNSGRNLNISGLADLNIGIFKNWDFYTGIGSLSEGATLWKIGINYRL